MAAANGNETARHDLVVVSNRLPVDIRIEPDGSRTFTHSPGGLVTALEPVTRQRQGAWVGWVGEPDLELAPFEQEGVRLVPVPLSAEDLTEYYEGFSNDTLWPLYHDVIVPPTFHRDWWERYRAVNERFALARIRELHRFDLQDVGTALSGHSNHACLHAHVASPSSKTSATATVRPSRADLMPASTTASDVRPSVRAW